MFKNKKFNIFYIVYVSILIILMIGVLKYVYDACEEYEENSSLTLIQNTIEKIKNEKGLDLTCNNIPSIDDKGNVSYTLSDEEADVCKLYLQKTSNTLFDLALFKIDKIEPLKVFTILSTSEETGYDYSDIVFFRQIKENLRNFPNIQKTNYDPVYSLSEIEVDDNHELVKVKDNTYLSLEKLDDDKQEEIQRYANKIINIYSGFIGGEISKDEMIYYVQYGSPLYNRLLIYKAFYTRHESISINNLDISKAYYLGNDYYLINAKYVFNTVINSETISDDTTLSIVIKDNGYNYSITEIANYFYYDLY